VTVVLAASAGWLPIAQAADEAENRAAASTTEKAVTVGEIAPVVIEAGGKSILRVPVHVASGYRVQANPASNEFLVPLELVLADTGVFGFGDPVYPEPEAYRLEGADDDLLTYRGDFEIVVVVSADVAAAAGAGTATGELRYQACNSRMCFFPESVAVDVLLDVAGAGDPGRQE
jgi:hypothetical protein